MNGGFRRYALLFPVVLFLVILISSLGVSAQVPLPDFMAVYGIAAIDGANVTNGTLIAAFIQNGTSPGIADGNFTVNQSGYFEIYIRNQSVDDYGKTITFSVGGFDASQTTQFQLMTVEALNLSVTLPPNPVSLIGPANNSISYAQSTQFNWSNTTDANSQPISFNFQLSNMSDFSELTVNQSLSALSTSVATSPSVPDGLYYWRVIATDEYSEVTSVVWQVTLKSTLAQFGVPSLNNSLPKINEYVNFSIAVNDTLGLQTIYFAWNNSGNLTNISSVALAGVKNALPSFSTQVTQAQGTVIAFQFTAQDITNQTAQSQIFTFTVGNTPPQTPQITFPTSGLITALQPLPLEILTTPDTDNDVLTIAYYINGTLNQSSLTNTTLNASDGEYILAVSVIDAAGASSAANASVMFTIDTTLPQLNSLQSNDSDNITGSTQMLNFTVVAIDMHLVNVTLNDTLMEPLGNDIYSAAFSPADFGCVSDGPCLLTARGVDSAGNIQTINYLLTVDTTPAQILSIVFDDADGITRSGTVHNFTVTASDLHIQTVTVNNHQAQQGTGVFFIVTTSSALGCSQGTCTLTALATDAAENQNTQTFEFIIDDTSPKIQKYNGRVTDNATLAGQQTVNVTVNDSATGISNVSIIIDGQTFSATPHGIYYTLYLDTTTLSDGAHTITALPFDSAGNTLINHVVISEVMFDPPGANADRQWIELYNPTANAINITGWKIERKSGTNRSITTEVIMAPYTTVVIVNNGSDFAQTYGFTPTITENDISGALSQFTASNDFLRIRAANNIIDEVSWGNNLDGSYNWSLFTDTNLGKSIARDPVSGDIDTMEDWQSNVIATPAVPANSHTITVIVDNSAPRILSLSRQNGSISKQGDIINVNITESVSSLHTVQFTVGKGNAVTVLSSALSSDGLWSASLPLSLADGRYNLSVFTNDSVGNSDTAFIEIVIDTTPPVAQTPLPPNGTYVNTTLPTFSVVLLDAVSGIMSSSINVSYLQNGALIGPVTPQILAVPDGVNISFLTPAPTDTFFNITVRAKDNANNSIVVGWSFGIDLKSPQVTGIHINDSDNVITPSAVINLAATIVDMGSGISMVTVGNTSLQNMSLLSQNVYAVAAPIAGFGCTAEGACTLHLTAIDNNGHVNASETLTLILDATNPQLFVSLNSSVVSNSTPFTATVTITDTNFGTGSVTIKNNSVINLTPTQSGNWQVQTTAFALGCPKNGVCNIVASAVDSAGNANMTQTVQITVDTTPPIVSAFTINDTDGIVTGAAVLNININVTEENGVAILSVNNTAFTKTDTVWSKISGVNAFCAAQGICTLSFAVADSLGNTNSTQSFSLIVDTTLPNITAIVHNATNNISRPKDILTITVTATDANGIGRVLINGTALSNLSGTGSTGTSQWSYLGNASKICGDTNGICIAGVTAFDKADNLILTLFNFTINKGNELPQILELPSLTLSEEGYNDTLLLDTYVRDEDTPSALLSWGVESISNPNISVAISPEKRVNVSGKLNWNGTGVVIFRVSDGDNTVFSGPLVVKIRGVDDAPPAPRLISPENNTVFDITSVTVSWNVSDEVDGEPVSYYVLVGTPSLLLNATTQGTALTLNSLDKDKSYSWAVYANDSKLVSPLSEIRNFNVTSNFAPNITVFTPDNTSVKILEKQTQQFTVTVHDKEQQFLSTIWYLDGINVSNSTALTSSFSYAPNLTAQGPHTLRVVVIDIFNAQSSVTWDIAVENLNQPPLLTVPAETLAATEHEQFTFTINASDFDNDPLTVLSNRSDVLISPSGTSRQVSFTPASSDIGTISIQFNATDPFNLTDKKSVTVAVANKNDPPQIISVTPLVPPIIPESTGSVLFEVTATDPDADSLTIVWTLNGVKRGEGAQITISGLSAGIYNLTAIINDSMLTANYYWNLTVSAGPVSRQYQSSIFTKSKAELENISNVVIAHPVLGAIDFGENYLNLSGIVDIDNIINISPRVVAIDTVRYPQLNVSAKVTMKNLSDKKMPLVYVSDNFKAEGVVPCPESRCTNKTYDRTTGIFTFRVPHFSTYVAVENTTNDKPVIISTPPKKAIINVGFRYTVQVADLDHSSFTYTLLEKPAGMSIDSSGTISWNPTEFGNVSVTVRVSDGIDSDTQSFKLDVVRGPPLIISDVDVKIDGKSSRSIQNNTPISRDAKPGSTVEFKVEVANTLEDNADDNDLEDVEVTINVEGIEDGDDFEDTASSFTLRPDKEKTVSFKFDVPLTADEDTYDVFIDAEAEDQNGTKYTTHFVAELEVEQEKHQIALGSVFASPSIVSCKRETKISGTVLNIGEEDEDDIIFEAASPLLNLLSQQKNIVIESGDSLIAEVPFKIADDAELGVYPVTVTAVLASRSTVLSSKTLEVTVRQCVQQGEIQQKQAVTTPPPQTTVEKIPQQVELITPPFVSPTAAGAVPISAPVAEQEIDFRDSDQYLVILLASVVLLAILVIAILTYLSVIEEREKKKRKRPKVEMY